MGTKLTVVVDNVASECMDAGGKAIPLAGEWGLCILAEHHGKNILVDVGSSDLFLTNMTKLGLDVADVDCGVLSHAHYDHANGMPYFFRANKRAKFYLQETAAEDCYFKKWIFRKYIGLPHHVLADYPDRIEFARGDYKLSDGSWLIPHKTEGLGALGKREMMYRKLPRGWTPDNFSHEQSLVLETGKGLVIINSCSHGGAANIVDEVAKTFPDKHVHAIIGGFHLFNKSEAEVRELSRKLLATGVDYVCTGHCTKERAYAIMKEELGDKLEQLRVGKVMEF